MARLNDKQRDDIVNAFHIGKSIYQIAKEFEVSTATVHKLVKDLTPKLKEEVKAEIAIKSKLSKESESLVKAFDNEVNDKLRRMNLVFGATEKALTLLVDAMENKKPVEKVGVGDGVQQLQEVEYGSGDYKNFIDAIDKASITLGVNQRHANTTINNTNATQNNTKFVGMRRMSDEEKREALEQNDR